jgi:hypothetical protein
MVEMKTVGNVTYYTDSNGLVAFSEPGLMDRRVYFFIKADGYEFPADGLGRRGRAFAVTPGGNAVVQVKRTEIAERFYRLTGEGMYRDTVLAGRKPPIEQPLVNGGISGMDGPQTAVYRGKVYWFFGDTTGIAHPLGNFAVTGATSELPGHGGLEPEVGVNLHYFVRPDGFVKEMMDLPGEGLKWLSGLMVLKDRSGQEHLFAAYQRVGQKMAMVETGLALYDDARQVFRKLAEFPTQARVLPDGRPFLVRAAGEEYYYQFRLLTLPWIRVKADWDAVQRPDGYEVYTCYGPRAGTEPERDAQGKLVCGWKHNADPMFWDDQKALIASGKLKPEESLWQMRDLDSGQLIEARMGTVFWNEYRQRWVGVFQRPGNAVYFAEADTPVGPWVYAKKVAEFERYTFYWPGQLPYFDQRGGRTIYFAGTYTAAFSSAPFQTPRYDYNVLMYRLALDDPRLALPAPVYQVADGNAPPHYLLRDGMDAEDAWKKIESISFFAVPPHAAQEGLIPIYAERNEKGSVLRARASTGDQIPPPLFYALPADSARPAAAHVLSGKWSCKAKAAGTSDDMRFVLHLRLDGEHVSPGYGSDVVVLDGTLKGGELRLRLKDQDGTYTLSGELKQGELGGTWQSQTGKLERGTWRCESGADAPLPVSPAAVPLFEYAHVANGSHLYSTEPNLPDRAYRRTAEPVCRVWLNPASQLALDPDAKPVTAETLKYANK